MNACLVLALEFSAGLRKDISAKDLAEVIRRNVTQPYRYNNMCASHDFCDANVVMWEAFERVMRRAPVLSTGAEPGPDLELWAAAWKLARENNFAPSWRADEGVTP